MNTDLRNTLNTVFCDVLEHFAFSFASPVAAGDEISLDPDLLCASMEFHGPAHGALTLIAPESLCRTVAVNAIGVDDEADVSRAVLTDTLAELLNITCGNLLTATWGTSPVFDLSIPFVHAPDADEIGRILESPECSAFLVDDDVTVLMRATYASCPHAALAEEAP